MACSIRENQDGTFAIVMPCGSLARTTEGSVFLTTDRALAGEALAYLNQTRGAVPNDKRQGSHRMKSTFGVL